MVLYALTYGANATAFAGIIRWGRGWERVAVGALMVSILADPFLAPLSIGTWRAGVAIPNAVLLAALWASAHRSDRWWLIAASSLQLVIVATHLLPVLTSVHLVWSGFMLRRSLYVIMSLVFLAGAWEALADRRLRRGTQHGLAIRS